MRSESVEGRTIHTEWWEFCRFYVLNVSRPIGFGPSGAWGGLSAPATACSGSKFLDAANDGSTRPKLGFTHPINCSTQRCVQRPTVQQGRNLDLPSGARFELTVETAGQGRFLNTLPPPSQAHERKATASKDSKECRKRAANNDSEQRTPNGEKQQSATTTTKAVEGLITGTANKGFTNPINCSMPRRA